MTKLITAYTSPTAVYPPYVNISRDENGEVIITVRAHPTERDASYVCGYASDRGRHGRCTPGDENCNNYCNMAPSKGPMADHPKSCKQVLCGETASFRVSAAEWDAVRAEIIAAA